MEHKHTVDESNIFAISRPAPALMKYYILTSLALGPFFFFVLVPLYFRYHTLRYHFDSEGISMRWGILFRREINLTDARIQDIHLRSDLVDLPVGVSNLEVQTASGSAGAEMVLEGLMDFEMIRDYLYSRMRGGHGVEGPSSRGAQAAAAGVVMDADTAGRLIETLNAVTGESRAPRETLARRTGEPSDG